ncbi:MAG: serine/threonine protein kinase [Chloroflexi bacterium]|nr:serine/threonine protein kinase [Chloroflexota bacterium]
MAPKRIADRYELRDRIGVGGAAEVYHALDLVLGRDVAVKVLHREAAGDPLFVERFKREARAAAALNHPNVVSIYDWGAIDDTYYMVMEYVNGPDLKKVLRDGPLPEREALRIAQQVAEALEAAHAKGIIHRDVKPHNILLGPDGRVKVADFGIARAIGLSQLTKTNMVAGTAHYVSPEQVQRHGVDARSDVYSLGVVLYEMLTGQEPFRGDSMVELALQHVHERPVPPRQLQPEISRATEAAVLKALAKDPADRFATAADFRKALADASRRLEEEARERERAPVAANAIRQATEVRTPPVGSPLRTRAVDPHLPDRSPERRGALAWLMAVPLLVLIAAALFLAVRGHGASPSAGGGRTPVAQHLATAPPTPTRPRPAIHATSTPLAPAATATPAPTATSPPPTAAPTVPLATVGPAPTNPPPNATATSVVVASTNGGTGPQATVSDFYADISAGQLDQASSLWTDHMKRVCDPGTCIHGRFDKTQSITPYFYGKSVSGDRATVRVKVLERDVSGSHSSYQWFYLTWYLVKADAGWMLDNVSQGW